jgi:hypothetical protein
MTTVCFLFRDLGFESVSDKLLVVLASRVILTLDPVGHMTSFIVMTLTIDEASGVFKRLSPFSLTMALGFTHPLTKMSTRIFLG